MKLTINSSTTLSDAIGALREAFAEHRYFQVTISTGKKRSINQNYVSHGWYEQVSKEEGEYTAGDVKSRCKYHFGVPILRAEDKEYNDAYEASIGKLPLYEDRIKAMEYWPVTSLMKTKQMTRYMEQVQNHYAGRVMLEFKEK
jgi:hypothetical protein